MAHFDPPSGLRKRQRPRQRRDSQILVRPVAQVEVAPESEERPPDTVRSSGVPTWKADTEAEPFYDHQDPGPAAGTGVTACGASADSPVRPPQIIYSICVRGCAR